MVSAKERVFRFEWVRELGRFQDYRDAILSQSESG
jgi:hypothetical protein